MVENNIGLLGEMTNGMIAERVPCSASSPAMHTVIWEGPATAETRVIMLERLKTGSLRGSYLSNPSSIVTSSTEWVSKKQL